jgi:hypothetical protein
MVERRGDDNRTSDRARVELSEVAPESPRSAVCRQHRTVEARIGRAWGDASVKLQLPRKGRKHLFRSDVCVPFEKQAQQHRQAIERGLAIPRFMRSVTLRAMIVATGAHGP